MFTAQPRRAPSPGAWTLCRDVRIDSLTIKKDKLKIAGRRVLLYYDQQQKEFRDIAGLAHFEDDKSRRRFLDSLQVSFEIQLEAGSFQNSIPSAMSKLFYASEQEFVDAAPDVWKPFLQGKTDKERADYKNELARKAMPVTNHVGNGVTAPVAVYSPDPDYSEQAVPLKYQGTNVFTIIVDKTGRVARIWVARPLGMGMDERGAERIISWRFKPARKDGEPVSIEVSVEMTFNLY